MKNKRIISPSGRTRLVARDPDSGYRLRIDGRDRQTLGAVEDDIDHSLKFIQRELSAFGIDPKQADRVLERIKNNVIRRWAGALLWGNEGPTGRDEFMEAKFGSEEPEWPPV